MARPRSQQARQKALDAAGEVVADVGIEAFTVDAVAARSGVAKTTIYRHWESTNDLLIAALDCMIESMPTPNTGSLRSDLVLLYHQVAAMLNEPQMFQTMLGVLSRAAVDPDFNKLKQQFEHERHQPLRTVLQLAQARGEVAQHLDIDLLMTIVEGPIAARKLMQLQYFDVDEIEPIVDLLLDGVFNQ